ncbi:MAG: hypothetical protein Q7K42_02895 [Candidatus Diapherotrites archaeon]|nr:hypothetical protein [Candidatus Diapherotrites archaeon]
MVSKSELMEAARLVLENASHGISHNVSLRQLSQAGYDENAILEIMEASIQMESAIGKTSAKKTQTQEAEKEFEKEKIQSSKSQDNEIQEQPEIVAQKNFQKLPATIKGFDVIGMHVSGANETFTEEFYSQELDAKELFGESFEKGPEKPITYLEFSEIEATKIETASKHRPKFFEEKEIETIYEAEKIGLNYRESLQELTALITENKQPNHTKKLVHKTLKRFAVHANSGKINLLEQSDSVHNERTQKAKERFARLRRKLHR